MGNKLISTNDNGLYLHQPDFCTTKAVVPGAPEEFYLQGRPTSDGKVRLYPSQYGWVATVYEDKRVDTTLGRLTLFVQLDQQHQAWQRIEWPADFDDWKDPSVQAAIDNFLAVAVAANKIQQKNP